MKYVNNAAYYITDNKLVLFDCGETVFHEIMKMDIINENISSVDVVITHFHSDHVGSLGSLIFYCRYKQIKDVTIIFPIKELPYSLLRLYGIQEELFKVKTPNEITDYYLKEYEQVHGDVSNNGTIIPMPSYGYHLINHNDNFFYSGDTCSINDIILNKFKKKEIKIMYHEVTNDGYKAHVQIEELVKQINKKDRKRVICMHLGDNVDIESLKKLGFKSAR